MHMCVRVAELEFSRDGINPDLQQLDNLAVSLGCRQVERRLPVLRFKKLRKDGIQY